MRSLFKRMEEWIEQHFVVACLLVILFYVLVLGVRSAYYDAKAIPERLRNAGTTITPTPTPS